MSGLLEITGKNFGSSQGNSFVSFGGINASVYEDWSQTTIVVEVPDEIESGQLWVVADGQKSNEVVYGLFTIEVTILPPRIITYEMMQGATEVEHPFEAYALPDSVYRYVWDFNDGNTFSEARSKGQTSKINHRYAGLQNGDLFRPSVAVYDLEDKLLASDNISIAIVEYAGYECNPCTFEVNYDELEKVEDWRSVKYKKKGTNILHGPYMTWHDPERNQMAVCLCYKDGKEDGKYILWYQNGNKEWDRNYLNGVPEGTWIFWYANGNKMREEYYSKGLLYKYVSYYSESGRIASVRFYANNMRHGSHTYWYESGMLMKEEHYKDGELDGVYIEWHENGQKKLERFYKNGKLNGRQTGWDIDGNISWEGDWVDDKQVGIWRYCYLLNCECRNYADGSTGAYVIVPCP